MDLSLWRVWVRKLLTSFVAEGKKVLQRRSESYRHRSWVPSLLASAESPSPPGTSDIAFPHIHLQHHTEPPNIQPPLLKQSKQRSDQARDSSKMFRHALRQFGFEQLRGGQRGFFTNNVGAVWEAWKRYHGAVPQQTCCNDESQYTDAAPNREEARGGCCCSSA